jgi:hypothetical protein
MTEWIGYEEARDRLWHMRWFGGLTPEETALGCTISECNPYPIKLEEEEEE